MTVSHCHWPTMDDAGVANAGMANVGRANASMANVGVANAADIEKVPSIQVCSRPSQNFFGGSGSLGVRSVPAYVVPLAICKYDALEAQYC